MVESLPINSSWASFRCDLQGNFSARLYYTAFSKEAGACGRGNISGGVENYLQYEHTTMFAYILFFISHFRFSCSGIGKTSKRFLEEEEFGGVIW